jgi:hypothetical protein
MVVVLIFLSYICQNCPRLSNKFFPKIKYNETATNTTPVIILYGMFTIADRTEVFQLE